MATIAKPICDVMPVKQQVSAEEWALRVDLACAYRLVAYFGWDDLIFTHLSTRVPGPEHHFLLNPYNQTFDEITASSLIKVDMNGQVVLPADTAMNAAGFTIHSAVHMAREDAHCVMHLHTPHGQAVSAMSEGLMPLTQTALNVYSDLSYHQYEGIATDLDERERIVSDLGANNLLILRNHGTLAVGETIADAFLRMYFLERACEAQVLALTAGRSGIDRIADGTSAKVRDQNAEIGKFVSRNLTWPALVRKMDRVSPGFRE